jgi:hypothetical protein
LYFYTTIEKIKTNSFHTNVFKSLLMERAREKSKPVQAIKQMESSKILATAYILTV